jgi:hypothetical protein
MSFLEPLQTCVACREDGGDLCESCFDDYLRSIERGFLENYARFGARQRMVVAESLLRALVLADIADRKLLAMTIVEQLLGAATDVIGLFQAIRDRLSRPIVRTFLDYELESPVTTQFFSLLSEGGDAEVLAALAIPHPARLQDHFPRLTPRRRAEMEDAIFSVLEGLDKFASNAPATRVALLQAQNERRRGLTVTDGTSWLQREPLAAGQVAALSIDPRRRRLLASPLAVDEDNLGELTSAIGDLAGLARDLVFVYLATRECEAVSPDRRP